MASVQGTRVLLDGDKTRRMLELRIVEDKLAEAQGAVNKAQADYSAEQAMHDMMEDDPTMVDNLSLSEDARHRLRRNRRRNLRDINTRIVGLTETRNSLRLELSQIQTYLRRLQQQIDMLQKQLEELER